MEPLPSALPPAPAFPSGARHHLSQPLWRRQLWVHLAQTCLACRFSVPKCNQRGQPGGVQVPPDRICGREKEAGDKTRRQEGRETNNLATWLFIKCTGTHRPGTVPPPRRHVATIFSWSSIEIRALAKSIPFSFNTFERPSDL